MAAYTINLTDGSIFATVPDGTVNQTSSVTLVGKNFAGYGEFLDENFIQMLENFSNSTAPASPLTGQIWWDKTNALLKVYNGTLFKTLSFSTASATQPTSNVTGDLWYDTTNQQLKVYTGSSYIVVGPAYSSATGTAGAIPETINDNSATPHYVTSLYVANTRVAIFSTDSTFTAAAPVSTTFPTVYKGVTFTNASGTNMAGNIISGSNVVITAGGATTATITSTGANVTGYTSVSGNVTGGNVLTGGLVSVAGNVTAANFFGNVVSPAGSNVSTTGNVTAGNILTGGLVSAGGTITGTSHLGAVVSVTGNVTGGNVLYGAGIVSGTGSVLGGIVSASGNITAGNVLTGGIVSAVGNITAGSGNFFIGNGSQLSGLSLGVSVSKISSGNSYANIATPDGNLVIGVNGTAVVTVDSTTIYTTNVSATGTVRAATVNAATIGNASAVHNGATVSITGTVTAATVNAATIGNASASLVGGTVNAATIGNSSASFTGGTISLSGNVTTAGVLLVNSGGNPTAIVNSAANVTGNIGSSTGYFNRIFAQATTALYADVAERFAADEFLEAGTVVELGGPAEITRSLTELSENVFGVISTHAAYLMNGGAGEDDTHPPVAMTGRVPVKVVGVVHKGDRLVSAGNGIARAAKPGEATSFNVIGRSLVDKLTPESATIEAIVTIKN
jgi:hypothetical protein